MPLTTAKGSVWNSAENNLAVNVKDAPFNAKGDGVTDDTAAIQAAVDSKLGAIIFIPQGTYRITSPILQSTIGLGSVSVCQFQGDGMGQTVIDNQSGDAAFRVTSGAGVEFAYNFGLFDLSIVSTTGTAGTIGIDLIGCRFVKLERLKIEGMGSHGIYGASTVGDLTDSAHVNAVQIQIEGCGGSGVYAKTDGNAIQYNWNFYECRIGNNTLGGMLLESMTNCEIKNCGIYYNDAYGIKVKTGTSSAPAPKVVSIVGCEFDSNEGIQIDIESGTNHLIHLPYLIDNNLTPAFTKGIVLGSGVSSTVISQASPRMNPLVTGKNIVEVTNGAIDIVIRDSGYQGWSGTNGTYYVDNTAGEVTIDDKESRNSYFSGTYTANLVDVTGAKTSATTVTAYYHVQGDWVTVGFRNFNNLDLSPFVGSDILAVTLPFACAVGSTLGFIGSAIITSDTGTGAPYPSVENGSPRMPFLREGTGSFLVASDLTTGVSDIRACTVKYLKA